MLLMTTIHSREFLVIVTLTLLVSSGLPVHSHNSLANGNIPSQLNSRKVESTLRVEGTPGAQTYYLTENLTIPANTTYVISNENVVLQSLSLQSIHITSHGTLEIINSSLSVSNETYSTVRTMSLLMDNLSRLYLINSSILAPGSLTFKGSNVTIINSCVNSSTTGNNFPSQDSLTMEVINSTMNLVNSTISGLYNQSHQIEYRDSSSYLYETPYSQNNALPLKSSSYADNRSFINGVWINATYYGNANETASDSIEVYYNGTLLENLLLPYNTNQTSAAEHFYLPLEGNLHNLSWLENTSDFKLVSNINYSYPIALTNLTVEAMSNDTVDLYGYQYYSYVFTDSTIVTFNSTLGLNQLPLKLDTGEPNFRRLSLYAYNSTLYFGDTDLNYYSATYSTPFFILSNSSIFLFREIQVISSYHGIPYDNPNFTLNITDNSSTGITTACLSTFLGVLNSTGDNWITFGNQRPALYEATQDGETWNYSSQFSIESTPGEVNFTIQPFPYLSTAPLVEYYELPVPYATFNMSTNLADYSGIARVNYTGNLSGLPSLKLEWTLYRDGIITGNGQYVINNPAARSYVDLPVVSPSALSSGLYTLIIVIQSSEIHAFGDTGTLTTSFEIVHPSQPGANYTIMESGLTKGEIWGIDMNGTDYFTGNTSLTLYGLGNQTVNVIVPNGFRVNDTAVALNVDQSNYSIEFFRLYYKLTFSNTISKYDATWQVIVDGNTYSTNGSTLTLDLVPGDYNYEVMDPPGFTITNSSGLVNLTSSSQNVTVISVKQISIGSRIVHDLGSPHYYVPLSFVVLGIISLIVRNEYHSWYVCEVCGASRKKKKDKCQYCGKL